MRPNFAMDAPPTELTVGGHPYKINTDFRVWLNVLERFKDVSNRPTTKDAMLKTAEAIEDIETMVFGGILEDETLKDTLAAISEFMKGYPSAPMHGESSDVKTYSFYYDLNEIIIAIRNQHNVDLSYRNKEGCHWWEFLLYFHTLSGEHYILNLMNSRGYKGKDKELQKRRNAVALPQEMSADEQADNDAFNAMFEVNDAE